MTRARAGLRDRLLGGGRRGRWLLLGTAVAQLASPAFVPFDLTGDDTVLVPPGPFFAIWGPITVGCLVAAVRGFPLHRATSAPWREVQLPLSVAQVGYVAWLVAAAAAPRLTLPVFLGMLAALAPALRAVVRTPGDPLTRLLLGGSIGLYAGWTSAAVWLNAGVLVPTAGPLLLAALLVGAAATGVAGARLSRGQPGYLLAVGWALLGGLVSTARDGEPALAALAAAGLAALAAAAATARLRPAPPVAAA